MRILIGLAAFAKNSLDGYVLTTSEGQMPVISLDEDKHSLDVARQALCSIIGYSSSWPIPVTQSGTYEFHQDGQKELVITYTAYFPAIPSIEKQFNQAYQWTKIKDLFNDRFNNILRHISIQRF